MKQMPQSKAKSKPEEMVLPKSTKASLQPFSFEAA